MTLLYGLDMGRFAVKGALFEKKFRTMERLRLMRRMVAPTEGEEAFIAAVRTAKALLAESGYDEDEDALAVVYPSRLLNWRPMTSPFNDQRKIEETLPFEIETQTPFGADAIVAGYQVVAEKEGESSLLVCVTPKHDFENFLLTLREEGLSPDKVVAAPFIAEGAAGYAWRPGVSIDVGSDGVRVALTHSEGARCHYAEKTGEDDISDAALVSFVAREVRRLSTGLEKPHEGDLTLSGGGGSPSFGATLATALHLPLNEKRTFSAMPLDDDRSALRTADRTLFGDAVAAAAALAPEKGATYCNLLTPQYMRKRKFGGSGAEALFTGSLLALFILVGLVTYVAEGFSLQSRLDEAKGALRQEFQRALPNRHKIISVIPQLKAALGELQGKENALGAGGDDPVLDHLHDVTGAVGKATGATDVTSLVYERSLITLEGQTASFDGVATIRKELAALPWVVDVTAPESKAAVAPGRVDFRIEVKGR